MNPILLSLSGGMMGCPIPACHGQGDITNCLCSYATWAHKRSSHSLSTSWSGFNESILASPQSPTLWGSCRIWLTTVCQTAGLFLVNCGGWCRGSGVTEDWDWSPGGWCGIAQWGPLGISLGDSSGWSLGWWCPRCSIDQWGYLWLEPGLKVSQVFDRPVKTIGDISGWSLDWWCPRCLIDHWKYLWLDPGLMVSQVFDRPVRTIGDISGGYHWLEPGLMVSQVFDRPLGISLAGALADDGPFVG